MAPISLWLSILGCDQTPEPPPQQPPGCFADADGDGAGDPAAPVPCDRGVASGDDCDDTDAAISPVAPERCNGADDDCDGLVDQDDELYVCGHCPDASELESATFEWLSLDPCTIDARLSHCDSRIHQLVQRTDGHPMRDELLLFLPPGPGAWNNTILRWGALAGYRVLSLGWVNEDHVIACMPDGDCLDDGRWELLYGEDRSEVIEVEPHDALVSRLHGLLAHLDAVRPEEGWSRYYDAGGVRWEAIVAFGWSFGAGQAAYLAKHHQLDGLILLSGPQEFVWPPPRPSPWIFEPRATPVCAQWGLYHLEEAWFSGIDMIGPSLDGLGLQGHANVDVTERPYGGAQILTTASSDFLRDNCNYHSAVAMDGCMDQALIEPYLHLFCTAAQVDSCTP